MIILGLDQSYTSTGYVAYNTVTKEVLDFGTFQTSKDAYIYTRAQLIADFVTSKIAEHSVEMISIEGLAFGMRGDATRDLAGLQFVIITSVLREFSNTKVEIITPKSLKKFATDNGKATKSDMIDAVPTDVLDRFKAANYKKTTGLADIVDAYWLALVKA